MVASHDQLMHQNSEWFFRQPRRDPEAPPADPRLLDRRDDAGALVTGRFRGDILCRSDEHLVSAGDGLPLRGKPRISPTIAFASEPAPELTIALARGCR